jgi:hypothetical protein
VTAGAATCITHKHTCCLLLLFLVLACSRAYCRVSDSWRGNLVVQGLRNVADNISHKVRPWPISF